MLGRSVWRPLMTIGLLTLTMAGCSAGSAGGPAGPSVASNSGSPPSGPGNQVVLVGLGDSITAGTSCGGCKLFVDLVAHDAAQHLGRPVQAVNRGEEGHDSNQLLDEVQHDQFTRNQIAKASIVLVMIGINDENCPGAGGCPNQVHRNLETILSSIRQIRGSSPTAIRVIDYYNYSLGDPKAPRTKNFQSSFRADLARLNDGICRAARDNGAICIDIEPAFNGTSGTKVASSLTPGGKATTSLLDYDHLHPAQHGHQLIAKLIEAQGYAPLH